MEKKTAMPLVAGILDILSGVFSLLGVLGLIIAIVVTSGALGFAGVWVPVNVTNILWSIAIPLAIVGTLSLIGGIYAVQRKMWGLALAGSIVTVLPSFLLGVAALILVALSKDEFE